MNRIEHQRDAKLLLITQGKYEGQYAMTRNTALNGEVCAVKILNRDSLEAVKTCTGEVLVRNMKPSQFEVIADEVSFAAIDSYEAIRRDSQYVPSAENALKMNRIKDAEDVIASDDVSGHALKRQHTPVHCRNDGTPLMGSGSRGNRHKQRRPSELIPSADSDDNSSAADDEESRNNTYWVEAIDESSSLVGFVCWWYGENPSNASYKPVVKKLNAQLNEDFSASYVEVTVVAPAIPLSIDYVETYLASSSAPMYYSEHVSAMLLESHQLRLDAAILRTPGSIVRVPRRWLRPADENIIRRRYAPSLKNCHGLVQQEIGSSTISTSFSKEEMMSSSSILHYHFVLCLLRFAEWDQPERYSYMWPQFIFDYLCTDDKRWELYNSAVHHPLRLSGRSISDCMLFELCLQRSGLEDQFDDDQYLRGYCSPQITYLMSTLHRLLDEKNSESFRSCSRHGADYQAEIPPIQSDSAVEKDKVYRSEDPSIECLSGRAVVERLGDDSVDAFLGAVHSLRLAYLSEGQLVEAPFPPMKEFTHRLNSASRRILIAPSCLEFYRSRKELENVIAVRRRRGRRLYALATFIRSHESSESVSVTEKVSSISSGLTFEQMKQMAVSQPYMMTSQDSDELNDDDDWTSSFVRWLDSHTFQEEEEKTVIMNSNVALSSPFSNGNAISVDRSENSSDEPDMVLIRHHGKEVPVPRAYCRPLSFPDEEALDLLARCNYKVITALEIIDRLFANEFFTKSCGAVGIEQQALADDIAKNLDFEGNEEIMEENDIPAGVSCSLGNVRLCRYLLSAPELDMLRIVASVYHEKDLRKIRRTFNRGICWMLRNCSPELEDIRRVHGVGRFLAYCSYVFNPESPDLSWQLIIEVNEVDGVLRCFREWNTLLRIIFPDIGNERLPLLTHYNARLFLGTEGIPDADPFDSDEDTSFKLQTRGRQQHPDTTEAILEPLKLQSLMPGHYDSDGLSSPLVSPISRDSLVLTSKLWPPNLPRIDHNLYLMRNSSCPCLCYSLNVKNPFDVRLQVICFRNSTYHHVDKDMSPAQLLPLDVYDLKHTCTDTVTSALACALIEFSKWERAQAPSNSFLHQWYTYPEFITTMLKNNPNWTSWRKAVEREMRHCSSIANERENQYLKAFQRHYLTKLSNEQRTERFQQVGFPWDDNARDRKKRRALDTTGSSLMLNSKENNDQENNIIDSKTFSDDSIESFSETFYTSDEGEITYAQLRRRGKLVAKQHARRIRKMKRKMMKTSSDGDEEVPKSKKKRERQSKDRKMEDVSQNNKTKHREIRQAPTETVPSPIKLPFPIIRSWLNMFWLPRSNLMCLYNDAPEKRYTLPFRIMPVCCFTYHYPVTVTQASAGSVQPFQANLIKQCTDERTAEFSLALMDFAMWDSLENGNEVNNGNGHASSIDLSKKEMYDWPAFILELINRPKEWYTWRKQAERVGRSSPDTKRNLYFKALCEQHIQMKSSDSKTSSATHISTTSNEVAESEFSQGDLFHEVSLVTQSKKGSDAGSRGTDSSSLNNIKVLAKAKQKKIDVDHDQKMLPPKRKKKGMKERINRESDTEVHIMPPEPTLKIRSTLNMFWISTMALPALFYDEPQRRYSDRFFVKPISTFSYHYPLAVDSVGVGKVIEPLSMHLLMECTVERTSDFTLALIDFARWILEQQQQQQQQPRCKVNSSNSAADTEEDNPYFQPDSIESSKSTSNDAMEKHSSSSNNLSEKLRRKTSSKGSDDPELFDWPLFIFNLMEDPDEWSAWRKKAERIPSSMLKNIVPSYLESSRSGSISNLRRMQYFFMLKNDYELIVHGKNSLIS